MILIIYVLLLINSIWCTDNMFLIEYFEGVGGEYIVYTNSSQVDSIENVDIVKNHNGQIFTTKTTFASNILNNIDGVASEKIVSENISIDDVKNILNMKILEEIIVTDNIVLYNCYTSKLNRKVSTSSGVINLQIAVQDDTISIGYPYLVDY